jgi:hypothetical protein
MAVPDDVLAVQTSQSVPSAFSGDSRIVDRFVGKLAHRAAAAVIHSLTQPVTRRCSLLIRGAPSKNVPWPEK